MKKRIAYVTAISFLMAVLFLTGHVFAQETVTIAGTGACQTLLRSLSASFSAGNPGIKVEVPDSVGSGGGVKAAAEETAQLGRIARVLKDSEKGYGLEYLAFARMPVVLAAHPSVPALNISAAQARDIFTGRITNWNEVGGPDMKIRVISRHERESSLLVLKDSIPEWANIVLTDKSKMGTSDQETIAFIKDNEGAVGFGVYNQTKEAGLTILKLNGLSPLDDAYPSSIEFAFVYKPAKMAGAAKKFVDYVFSPTARKVINENYAVQASR